MDQPWKMLVYISADNTLYSDALVSLRQLTDASLLNNVDIIVQLDGPNSDQVSRYRCVAGQKQLLWQAPSGYTSDRSARLQHFLGMSATTPPGAMNSYAMPSDKQRIGLVLWGHGAGLDTYFQYSKPPQAASAETNLSNNANMYVTNIQLGNDLSAFSKKINRKIDLLGLDSCLMGMAEICDEVSSAVSVMVASDQDVPDQSWPYDTILGDLNKFPGMDANTLSTVIINRYLERYPKNGNNTRVSLSSMNLEHSPDLVGAMTSLVDALNKALDDNKDGTVKNTIFRARDASRTPDEVTYIDFGVFCDHLSKSFAADSAVSSRAEKVRSVLLTSPYILYHRDSDEDGSLDPYGLAIYFPPTQDRITSQLNTDLTQEVLPRDDVKFPGAKTKFPGAPTKFPGAKTKSADVAQITGYEILWGHYVQLQFNQKTGWAKLVARLVGYPNTVQTAKDRKAA